MMRKLRLILPLRTRIAWCVLIVMPYLMACAADVFSLPNADGGYMTAAILSIVLAFFYGGYRVVMFHPFGNRKYGEWLATTPWTYGKPLPLGPIRLVWEDLLVVFIIAIAAAIPLLHVDPAVLADQSVLPNNLYRLIVAVGLAFFCGHLFCLTATIAESGRFIIPVLFIAPLMVYPHFDLWAGLTVMGLIYLIVTAGVRWTLARFPWDSPHWKKDSRELLLDEVFRQGLIGWPYRDIGPSRPGKKTHNLRTAIILSTLIAWWTLSLTHGGVLFIEWATGFTWQEIVGAMNDQVDRPPSYDQAFQVGWWIVVVLIAGGRTLAYLYGTWAPISLLGRITTGRLIVPGYDKIFIAPIVLLIYGWAGPALLFASGLPPITVPAISVFGLLILSMTMGPSLENWRFTGHHRVRSWGTPAQTTRRNNSPSLGTINLPLIGPGRR